MIMTYSQYGQLVARRHHYYCQPPSWSKFWQRDMRKTGTHIDTLGDNTPKSRRRVNRILSAVPERGLDALIQVDPFGKVALAQDIARRRERGGKARAKAEASQ